MKRLLTLLAIPILLTQMLLPINAAGSTLPEKFRKEGSETSDLSGLTVDSAKIVENLTIDDVEHGKIKFSEAVDLSGEGVAELFNNLDSYILMNRGSVEVKSDTLPFLNKKATITLYNINLSSEKVSIYRDGVLDVTATETTKYSLEERTLTFDVEGFSKYELGTDLVLNAPPTRTDESEITLTGSLIDKGSKVELIVNNGAPQIVEFDIRGEFSHLVQLSEGNNSLILTATSTSGHQTVEQLQIERISDEETEGDIQKDIYIGIGILATITLCVATGFGVRIYKMRKFSSSAK